MRGSAAAQVDLDAYPDPIHDAHRPRQMVRAAVNVLVQVDDAMLSAPLAGCAARRVRVLRLFVGAEGRTATGEEDAKSDG